MIDYNKIIAELTDEMDACDYRYNGMIPAYYQQEIRKAIRAIFDCLDSLKGLSQKSSGPYDEYKVKELLAMLKHETAEGETHYGARLKHSGTDTNVLTIDAGGLRALISYYATHDTDLENAGENEPKEVAKSVPSQYEVTEVCPHCGAENTFVWDVDVCGYEAFCPHCSNRMLLCDECYHADDNEGHKCDWHDDICFRCEDKEDSECSTEN